jgi:ABC-type sugar transport system ATPase subunit
MTVFENMAFALRVHGWSPDDLKSRVENLAERLGLSSLLERRPAGLSGGEAKRVSLGRALAFRPDILCLDEPLSALDATTHDSMCGLIRTAIVSEGVTAFLITHNPREAELLGDSVVRW